MSTLRPPSAAKLPSDIESNASPDSLRQGAGKPAASTLDDIPPMSTRFDKLPLSQRSYSPPAGMSAVGRPPPLGANSSSRSTKGGIYLITRILEKKHGAFFISRLILASGINLRSFDSNTLDDPPTVAKFVKTLRNMLSPADMAGLLSQAPSIMNTK